jgi:hypothetical protein
LFFHECSGRRQGAASPRDIMSHCTVRKKRKKQPASPPSPLPQPVMFALNPTRILPLYGNLEYKWVRGNMTTRNVRIGTLLGNMRHLGEDKFVEVTSILLYMFVII